MDRRSLEKVAMQYLGWLKFGLVCALGALMLAGSGCEVRRHRNPHHSGSSQSNRRVVSLEEDEIKIHQVIAFDNNSADILPSSHDVIDAVADLLNERQDINYIEIAGHASRSGDAYYNRALTQNRANAVMNALFERGVQANRMRAVGYGFYCEIAAGNDEANRRVEFKILRRDGKRTAYTHKGGGCDAAASKGIKPQPIPDTAPRQ